MALSINDFHCSPISATGSYHYSGPVGSIRIQVSRQPRSETVSAGISGDLTVNRIPGLLA